MSENTHHARAISRLHNGTHNEVARAQAEATLALAYEQRTANLIALFAVESDSLPALAKGGLGEAAWIEAAEQIVERLGL
jgi:hypothetical protein